MAGKRIQPIARSQLDGETMAVGDGAVVLNVDTTHITALQDAELVMVEVA